MKLGQLSEATIYASDLDVAQQFYHGLLGLEVISRMENRGISFRCGATVLLVFDPAQTQTDYEELRLKEAGAPLHPRICSETANHLGYVDRALKGREFLVGNALTGADIQMSFVAEMAKAFDNLGPYPDLAAWLGRMHARPAFQRSIEKGGAYRFAK